MLRATSSVASAPSISTYGRVGGAEECASTPAGGWIWATVTPMPRTASTDDDVGRIRHLLGYLGPSKPKAGVVDVLHGGRGDGLAQQNASLPRPVRDVQEVVEPIQNQGGGCGVLHRGALVHLLAPSFTRYETSLSYSSSSSPPPGRSAPPSSQLSTRLRMRMRRKRAASRYILGVGTASSASPGRTKAGSLSRLRNNPPPGISARAFFFGWPSPSLVLVVFRPVVVIFPHVVWRGHDGVL